MIGLRKNSDHLDLFPDTTIARERTSPYFISKTSDGRDGIPGEISYPFKLPLTDRNVRVLGYPHLLQQIKTKMHDFILENDGMQLSAGKLVIDVIQSNLNQNNAGFIDTHFLSNASEFFTRIKDKKLKELSLGGSRIYSWRGYSRTALDTAGKPGFWKHIHDTWNYVNSDNGDYVFYPIFNDGYLGGTRGFQNEIYFNWAVNDVEFHAPTIVTALTPATYVKFVLVKIFEENGYTISGAPLTDYDFKKLTMLSFRGVYWSEIVWDNTKTPPVLKPTPRVDGRVEIKLGEHMPPTMTVAEFLVELQKFIPIAFEIDDTRRHCLVRWLNKIETAGAIDRTRQFIPTHTISLGEGQGVNKIYGFKRNVDPADAFVNTAENVQTPFVLDPVNMPYEPTGVNDYIESNISALPMYLITPVFDYMEYAPPGSPVRRPPKGMLGVCNVEGDWHGKDGELVDYKLRFMFYRGKTNMLNDGRLIPLGTHNVKIFNSVINNNFNQTDGFWSLRYENGPYGLINLWLNWLKVIGNNETLKGFLNMPLHEYLQLKWSEILLINSVPYLFQQIKELLPYNGRFEFEAVRKI